MIAGTYRGSCDSIAFMDSLHKERNTRNASFCTTCSNPQLASNDWLATSLLGLLLVSVAGTPAVSDAT